MKEGAGFNLAYVLEGAKLIIVETWGGGAEGAHLGGISDGVICLWGGTEILGGPPCTPLD